MKKRPNTHISAIFNELNISLFKFSNKYEAGVELIAFQDEEYFKVKYDIQTDNFEILKSITRNQFIIWDQTITNINKLIQLDKTDQDECLMIFNRIEEFYSENKEMFDCYDPFKRFYQRNFSLWLE
jgi:hypothetical protein